MTTLPIVLSTSITTAAITFFIAVAFFQRVPPKKDKWKQCPTCKRWEKAK